MLAAAATGVAPAGVEAAEGLVPDGSAPEDGADVGAEPFGTFVASEMSCGEGAIVPSGAWVVVGSTELGTSAEPPGARSEDPARSAGVAAAIAEAVGPAARSGAVASGWPRTTSEPAAGSPTEPPPEPEATGSPAEPRSEPEAGPPAESRLVPAAAGPEAVAPAEPGLGVALTSREAVGAGEPEPWLDSDAGEAGPALAVAAARGVTRTRAGVPM